MYNFEEIIKFKNKIKNIILEKPSAYSAILKNLKNIHLLTFINNLTPKLQDKKYSLSTKVYWVLNDLNDFPICPVCGKQFGQNKNVSLNRGYSKTCSFQCGSIRFIKQKKKYKFRKISE